LAAQQSQLADDEARWNTCWKIPVPVRPTAAARHDEAAARCPTREMRCSAGGEVTEARRALSEAEQALRLAEADKGHAQRALENLVQRRTRLEQDRQALGAPDPALLAASQEANARRGALEVARTAWRRCRRPYPRPRRNCAPRAKPCRRRIAA
jgi:chromosome segregation protein